MNKEFEYLLNEMPEFPHFLTIDELDASTKSLASAYPNIVTVSIVGYSKDNHPIQMLRIGNGSQRALFVGCPHPNEPIGALSLEYLSHKLCENPTLLKKLDRTFYIIKVIDIDGYRLNENWLSGPYSPDRYIRGYYRPPLLEQPEWTFPYEYKTFSFKAPSPETRAFMAAIDESKPHFLNSMHNAAETGTFFYISEVLPDKLSEKLRSLITKYNLPIMRGEAEAPFMPALGDGFYQLPKMSQIYDFYASLLPPDVDPATAIPAGASSLDYANSRYGTFTFVSEVTIFADKRMGDTTPTKEIRRDVVINSVNKTINYFSFIQKQYELAIPLISIPTRFQNAVASYIHYFKQMPSEQLKIAETDINFSRFASIAELFDNEIRNLWILLNMTSMFLRMLEAQPKSVTVEKIIADTKDWFEERLEYLLNYLEWKVQPLRDLCKVQLASAFFILEHLKQ